MSETLRACSIHVVWILRHLWHAWVRGWIRHHSLRIHHHRVHHHLRVWWIPERGRISRRPRLLWMRIAHHRVWTRRLSLSCALRRERWIRTKLVWWIVHWIWRLWSTRLVALVKLLIELTSL